MPNLSPPLDRRASECLLGAGVGPLTLRVCGGSQRGRIIRIRSQKCTIGSAAGCTLRLRARGVRPLHCWILRGRSGIVVRRSSADTLLNGLTYEDAPLREGDRLRIGPVELEVIECQGTPIASSQTIDATPDGEDRTSNASSTRDLEACLEAANDEISRLEADAQQAWQTSILASERAEQLREALERSTVEAGELRGEWETAQAALQQQCDELQSKASASERRLHQVESDLAAAKTALSQSQRDAEARTSQFNQERQSLQRRVEELQKAVEQAAAQPAPQPAQMTIPMDQLRANAAAEETEEWKSRCSDLESQLAKLQVELAATLRERDEAGQAELRLREADAQLEHWQAEAQRRQMQLEESQQKLAVLEGQQAQADQQSALKLDEERRALAELQSSLDDRQQTLAEGESQIQQAREQLARERQALEAVLLERQTAIERQEALLSERAQQFQARLDQAAAEQAELEQAREQVARQLAEADALQKDRLAEAAPSELPIEQTSPEPEALKSPDEIGVPGTSPVADSNESASVDSVLSRLVRAGLWRNDGDGEEPAAATSSAPPAAGERPSEPTAIGATMVIEPPVSEPAADYGVPRIDAPPEPADVVNDFTPTPQAPADQPVASASPAAAAHHEEESIESYMERLLQRVRGDGSSAPAPAPVAPVYQPPVVETKSEPAPLVPPRQETVKPEEYVPRSQAPELSSDLAAMRELANSAARSAIDKHSRTSGGRLAAGRLVGSGIILCISLFLAYWACRGMSIAAAIGAAIGLVLSLVGILGAFGRMLHFMRLRPAAHSEVASPPPAPAVSGPGEPQQLEAHAPSAHALSQPATIAPGTDGRIDG